MYVNMFEKTAILDNMGERKNTEMSLKRQEEQNIRV